MKVWMRGYNMYNKYERKVGEAGTPRYNKTLPKTINIRGLLEKYPTVFFYANT